MYSAEQKWKSLSRFHVQLWYLLWYSSIHSIWNLYEKPVLTMESVFLSRECNGTVTFIKQDCSDRAHKCMDVWILLLLCIGHKSAIRFIALLLSTWVNDLCTRADNPNNYVFYGLCKLNAIHYFRFPLCTTAMYTVYSLCADTIYTRWANHRHCNCFFLSSKIHCCGNVCSIVLILTHGLVFVGRLLSF